MGIHTYNCPTCQSAQRIRAEAGQVVEIQDCEACRQAKGELEQLELTDDEAAEQELLEELSGGKKKRR